MGALHKLVEPWLLDAESDDILALLKRLAWLEGRLFNEYEPDLVRSFDDRASEWLQNASDKEDRQAMFKLLGHLFFVGKPQFNALCQASYNDDVLRWVVDQEGIPLSAPNLGIILDQEVRRTWFCPVTDSMRINSFLKVNGLTGHDYRPDFRSLATLGDPASIRAYIAQQAIKRLVLLEDFVGSGNQMAATIEWAASILPDIQILLVPLICCPDGSVTGRKLTQKYSNVEFAPTLVVPGPALLLPTPQADEPVDFAAGRQTILRLQARLGKWFRQPFGYEGTGAIVVLYSNCPDNTIAMMHDTGPNWDPLFPRVDRG